MEHYNDPQLIVRRGRYRDIDSILDILEQNIKTIPELKNEPFIREIAEQQYEKFLTVPEVISIFVTEYNGRVMGVGIGGLIPYKSCPSKFDVTEYVKNINTAYDPKIQKVAFHLLEEEIEKWGRTIGAVNIKFPVFPRYSCRKRLEAKGYKVDTIVMGKEL